MKSVCLLTHEYDPTADFRLYRLVEWAGYKLNHFTQATISTRHTAPWEGLDGPPLVLFPMGPSAARAVGITQPLMDIRGYPFPGPAGTHVIPTASPAFIQRGNAKYSAAFINDLRKAVELARGGMPPVFQSYLLDPSPLGALEWARGYVAELERNPLTYLAFDIETPGKGESEEDLEIDSDAPDRTWHIDRIGFSYRPHEALSIPWEPSYMAAIRMVLGTSGSKVVWNAGFDVPRIRRTQVSINGLIHDGMVAWHILHTDLPKRLGFVATFTCPFQPAWKHLSGARPAFYNATDADVELRSMIAIEQELRKTGLWDVYQSDVLDLEPILLHMQQSGMPVDADIRLDRAIKLHEAQIETRNALEQIFPLETRKIQIVYKSTPKELTGLLCRAGVRSIPVCDHCGLERPPKQHFKRYVKKQNSCADRQTRLIEKQVDEYYRLAEFSPSRDQLVRYHQLIKRPLPMVWDKKLRKKKVSFAEKQVKELLVKYPSDPLYPLILEYRSIDKIAGTYIGRVV